MKIWIYTFVLAGFALFSCTSTEDTNDTGSTVVVETDEDLIERMPNMYREYYPGKKQLKMTGPLDNDGKRHGTWESFFENGVKNSVTYYVNGVRQGHSVVYYQNGQVFYIGEYTDDEKSGLWKTYNEKGELVSEDEF